MCAETGWTDVEPSHLAPGWTFDTQDGPVVIDQTKRCFRQKMFETYKLFEPTKDAAKTYRMRSAKSVEAYFDEISADAQNLAILYVFFVQ